MRWLRLGRGRTATALNPLLRGGTATLGEPALVLLDVDHTTDDARELLRVVKRHERVERAEGVPLYTRAQPLSVAHITNRMQDQPTHVAIKRVVVRLRRVPQRVLAGVCAKPLQSKFTQRRCSNSQSAGEICDLYSEL